MTRRHRWLILSGEYPPQPGGVSDYTRLVARGLAQAGDEVQVWAPAFPGEAPSDAGVRVQRLRGCFGLRDLLQLGKALRGLPHDYRILVQYVPQAFGCRGVNVPLCLWLLRQSRRRAVWVMFHEVSLPMGLDQPLKYNLLGAVHRGMAWLLLRAARRAFISVPRWETLLRPLALNGTRLEPLPVLSTLPTSADQRSVEALRGELAGPKGVLLGHFGTHGAPVRPLLSEILPALLCAPGRVLLLIGHQSEEVSQLLLRRHPGLRGRLRASGFLTPEQAAIHIAACDLLVQPYPDGVSGRRTSLIAAMALGRPILTTSGPLTEPFWLTDAAVALAEAGSAEAFSQAADRLIADGGLRGRLGARASRVYDERFSLARTLEALRS